MHQYKKIQKMLTWIAIQKNINMKSQTELKCCYYSLVIIFRQSRHLNTHKPYCQVRHLLINPGHVFCPWKTRPYRWTTHVSTSASMSTYLTASLTPIPRQMISYFPLVSDGSSWRFTHFLSKYERSRSTFCPTCFSRPQL